MKESAPVVAPLTVSAPLPSSKPTLTPLTERPRLSAMRLTLSCRCLVNVPIEYWPRSKLICEEMPSTITVRFLFAAVTENDSVASTPMALPVTVAGSEFWPRSVGKLLTCEYCAATLWVSEKPNRAAASAEASVKVSASPSPSVFNVISKLD